MTIHAWRNSGLFFSYRGHRIFYRDSNTGGEAIVFIHGFPTAGWDWSRLWPWLEESHRLLAPDLIGFGFSDKPFPYPYSIMDQADLMEAFIQHSGLSSCHIFAHDYGDTVAQELMARQAEERLRFDIRSVCLLNGGIFPQAHRPRPVQTLLAGPLGSWLAPLMQKSSLRRSFNNIFGPFTQPTKEEIDQFWELLVLDEGKQVIPSLLQYIGERKANESRWVGALLETAIPMRFINGCADPVSGRHMAEYYQQLVPHPDVILLEDIGHYPHMEVPETVLKHYLAFLAKCQGK